MRPALLIHSATVASLFFLFFFFKDPATTEIYTLSLHDALPICMPSKRGTAAPSRAGNEARRPSSSAVSQAMRSEEHTSELQSPYDLVCRLLLEKKKKKNKTNSDNSIKHNQRTHEHSRNIHDHNK